MNALDYAVLAATILGIATYGIWRTRNRRTLDTYLRGERKTLWLSVGLSVMATQASAVTFLSTPGQGFADGLGLVQMYFGMPLALVFISAVLLPIYRRLNVYTAYEYLGKRFDTKTRLLGAFVFLLQRGLGAGLTIYAPAIVLSTVMGWRLDTTIMYTGLVVIAYTTLGGSDAVNVTQKQQIAVIFAGMFAAVGILWSNLPADLTFGDTLALAGAFGKLQAVDYSLDFEPRYTFWSGVLGATFLMLAYFGADQSQVQRYLTGASLRESRLGLMFNAVFKIPMQVFILSLGVLLFVFFQFERPPVYFNQVAWNKAASGDRSKFDELEVRFASAHDEQRQSLNAWISARRQADRSAEEVARKGAVGAQERLAGIRREAALALVPPAAEPAGGTKPGKAGNPKKGPSDADYVFITFILNYLPHGLIGLLIAVFFSAALSVKAAELNSLSSTTTVDLYSHIIHREASDEHYLRASRAFTVMWGIVSIVFALFAALVENLIQAVNIVGSLFYPIMLGLFLVGIFLKRVGGTAAFWGALTAQLLVLSLDLPFRLLQLPPPISFLWYNPIGCLSCMVFSVLIQACLGSSASSIGSPPEPSVPTP